VSTFCRSIPGRPADEVARAAKKSVDWQVEREHIRAVLAESGGNRTRAAAVLGISQTTLWRRLKTVKGQG
jgi:transcriptional regulator with PAS, ATPase and Fis domain